MKAVCFILACFFLPIIFSSCKKDHELTITGKWISQETFAGYGDGGDFKWHSIPDQYKRTIEYTSEGYYIETTGFGSCNGTYTVTNHHINVITPCGSSSYSFYFEYLPNVLITYNIVREGVVKIKFSRVH